jgi:hypothetical protein
MIRVYHAHSENFRDTAFYKAESKICPPVKIQELWNAGRYALVAEVQACNLDQAYQHTNSIHDYWWRNPSVTMKFSGAGCRSTSVGDILETGGQHYVVAPIGFDHIRLESKY